MFIVGEPSILAKRLIETTQKALYLGISMVKPGAKLGDIGHAIQTFAESKRYSIVREYCGHGIGRVFHEEPQVLHYGKPDTGVTLEEGMTFTIEPMINAGKRNVKVLPDDWTVVTKDRSLSAQFEHTLTVTSTGFEIFTVRQDEPIEPTYISPELLKP
jgi:methionyl aminopeptidase